MGYGIQVSNEKYDSLAYSDQIINLTLQEAIGNFLPTFSMTFIDNDFDKLNYLNEKSPITIAYQMNEHMVSGEFIIKPVNPQYTSDTYTVALGGYLNKFNYFKGRSAVPYVEGTSVDALLALGQSYFGESNTLVTSGIYDLENNKSKTDDNMIWLHNGKNARNFVQEVWKHSYSPESLILLGIDLDGMFKIFDLATLISQEPKYMFCDTYEEGYEVYADCNVTDNSTGNTTMYGYTSERAILMEGDLQTVNSSVSPQVVMNTSTQMNESEMPVRQLTPMFQTSNVHKHWYEAYHQNFVRWSSLNNNTLKLTVLNNLLPLNIMDLIYVRFPQNSKVGRTTDGNFIISQKKLIFDNIGNVTTEYIGIREVSQSVNTAQNQESRHIVPYNI